MTTLPCDVANRALDAIGVPGWIGDLEEGTELAQAMLRVYGPSLRQLLRKAHWNFARRQVNLNLLVDSTGQTTLYQQQNNLPVTVGTGTVGMRPWIYSYSWPIDCVLARYVPISWCFNGTGIPTGNIGISPTIPIDGGLPNVAPYVKQQPSRFLVSYDLIPNLIGAAPNPQAIPDTSQLMGQALSGQTVILSNQSQATLIYTALATYPDQWDPLFSEAFVALLASRVAMKLCEPKSAPAIRMQQIAIAEKALDQARVSDGDEGWNTIHKEASWIEIRGRGDYQGGYGSWGGVDGGLGVLGYGYDGGGLGGGGGSAY